MMFRSCYSYKTKASRDYAASIAPTVPGFKGIDALAEDPSYPAYCLIIWVEGASVKDVESKAVPILKPEISYFTYPATPPFNPLLAGALGALGGGVVGGALVKLLKL
jgi:hypothetical protein